MPEKYIFQGKQQIKPPRYIATNDKKEFLPNVYTELEVLYKDPYLIQTVYSKKQRRDCFVEAALLSAFDE
jgi:hypothetical protein